MVSDLLKHFDKAVRAHQLYLPNNPMYVRAIDTFRSAVGDLWKQTDSLTIEITESQFRWQDPDDEDKKAFFEGEGRSSENLPWLFYKDGIRELTLTPGFEGEELNSLLNILQRVRQAASVEDDDLLTLFWEKDFAHLQYRYVDLGFEGSEGVVLDPSPSARNAGGGGGGTIDAPGQVERDQPQTVQGGGIGTEQVKSSYVKMDDFDSTLYFLDEREIEYLQSEIRKDFSIDLRPVVIGSLFDTFEQEPDPTVREEICGILDNLILLQLSNQNFRAVAYLIREAAITATRAPNLIESQRQRLLSLPERMSDPATLAQLLEVLEDTSLRPPQMDLNELFLQLKPSSLETILSFLSRTNNPELHALLENAATQIATNNSSELVRILSTAEEPIAIQAIRRAASLKTMAAVPALAKVLADGTTDMKQAAVAALNDIGSPGALQALERAIEDSDRDVRVNAVRIISMRNHKPAFARIERAVKERLARDANLTERMAFFEAYGGMCGEGGIPLLDGMLNPKGGLLSKKEDPEMRACAAVALGKIGTTKAVEVLHRASSDKDVIVHNAVLRALRSASA